MHKRIMFHCMAHSHAMEKYISKKIEKLDKFFKRQSPEVSIDIVLEPHRQKHFYKIACKVNSVYYHVSVHSQGMDMYTMIDETIRKVIKDITRKKEQLGHELHLSYV